MWSENDLKYLVDNYSKLSNQEIGEKLVKTKKSVDSKAIRLGLKKDSFYISNLNMMVYFIMMVIILRKNYAMILV